MEILESKSVQELNQIREAYVKKYIGDFNKPTDYKLNLKILDRTIRTKG